MRKIKMSWPEVVGWAALPAINKIHADRPDILEVEIDCNGDHESVERVLFTKLGQCSCFAMD